MTPTPCNGEHEYPLVWRHYTEQQPTPTNHAQEMVMAAFGGGATVDGKLIAPLNEWNGYCPRCGAAVEWSSDKPEANARPRRIRPKRWPSPSTAKTRRVPRF